MPLVHMDMDFKTRRTTNDTAVTASQKIAQECTVHESIENGRLGARGWARRPLLVVLSFKSSSSRLARLASTCAPRPKVIAQTRAAAPWRVRDEIHSSAERSVAHWKRTDSVRHDWPVALRARGEPVAASGTCASQQRPRQHAGARGHWATFGRAAQRSRAARSLAVYVQAIA